MRLLLLLAALPLACGCVVVKPHAREMLSLRAMDPASEALEDHFRQHWQESREGGSGGYTSAGGGCGCN
ncbi:MAG: DUF4266 domain-containing protein [Myxococcales bacterium]|nr:DUF4266 domain-containing protein [Myxococcales bacterium]